VISLLQDEQNKERLEKEVALKAKYLAEEEIRKLEIE
jgi:hypothetical protein